MEQSGFHGSLAFLSVAQETVVGDKNGENATERWAIDSLTVGPTVAESKWFCPASAGNGESVHPLR